MIPALRIIQDAVRTVLRVSNVSWMLTVTDEDGSGENPLFGSLTIIVPSGRVHEVMTAIGGEWENVTPQDSAPLYIHLEGNLEITLEEVVT